MSLCLFVCLSVPASQAGIVEHGCIVPTWLKAESHKNSTQYRWYVKIGHFRPICRYIAETVQGTDIVTMEG